MTISKLFVKYTETKTEADVNELNYVMGEHYDWVAEEVDLVRRGDVELPNYDDNVEKEQRQVTRGKLDGVEFLFPFRR